MDRPGFATRVKSLIVAGLVLPALLLLAPTATAATQPKIKTVGGGEGFSIALATNGDVYSWGFNGRLQLGRKATAASAKQPGKVTTSVKFTKISVGVDHVLAIGKDGHIYGWGDNSKGQLAQSGAVTSTLPRRIPTDSGLKFKDVAAGDRFSLAVSTSGKLFAWGDNPYGQIGNGKRETVQWGITQIKGGDAAGVKFTAVAAGGNHSLALDAKGNLYGWGLQNNGQLGLGDYVTSGANWKPSRAVKPAGASAGFKYVAIAAGAYHSLALGSDGLLYGWGENSSHQLAAKGLKNAFTPTLLVPGVKFTSVAAGEALTIARAADGRAYAAGFFDRFDLPDWFENNMVGPGLVTPPTGKKKSFRYAAVGAGWNQLLAVGTDAKLYACGSGADNQLGTGKTSNENKPTLVKFGSAAKTKTLTSAKPVISGVAKVGKTLKVNDKKAKWTKGTKLTYQWYARTGTRAAPIKNATGKTLKITASLKGKTIAVAVTGTKKGYQTEEVGSAFTKKVSG